MSIGPLIQTYQRSRVVDFAYEVFREHTSIMSSTEHLHPSKNDLDYLKSVDIFVWVGMIMSIISLGVIKTSYYLSKKIIDISKMNILFNNREMKCIKS